MCFTPNDVRIWQIIVHLLTDRGAGTEVVRLTATTAVRECADVCSLRDLLKDVTD